MASSLSTSMASWITSRFPSYGSVYKPKKRLNSGDTYKTKPELAVELIRELQHWGFCFEVVLADSLYGESGDFISELEQLHLKYVVAQVPTTASGCHQANACATRIGDPLNASSPMETAKPALFGRVSDGERRRIRCYHLTTDPATLPKDEHLLHHDQSGGDHWENSRQ